MVCCSFALLSFLVTSLGQADISTYLIFSSFVWEVLMKPQNYCIFWGTCWFFPIKKWTLLGSLVSITFCHMNINGIKHRKKVSINTILGRTESYINVHKTDPGTFQIRSKLCLYFILYMKAMQVKLSSCQKCCKVQYSAVNWDTFVLWE